MTRRASWRDGKSINEKPKKDKPREEDHQVRPSTPGKPRHATPAELREVAVIHIHGLRSPMGHYLIETSENRFYHVDNQAGKVRSMDRDEYRRYLALRREITRTPMVVKDPKAAAKRLNDTIDSNWDFGIYMHNCRDFVEYVIGEKVN